MVLSCLVKNQNDWMKLCMHYEIEHFKPKDRPTR